MWLYAISQLDGGYPALNPDTMPCHGWVQRAGLPASWDLHKDWVAG